MAEDTTISGLSSGIDWATMVDQLIALESKPVELLLDKQDDLKLKRDAWTSIQTKLEALEAKSKSMDERDELLQMSASSTDTDVVTASANADANTAAHTIEINQLAQSHIMVHSDGSGEGWASLNTSPLRTNASGTAIAGTFSYDVYDDDTGAVETFSVNISAGATLADLVSKINRSSDNPGVTASTIDDGGTTNPIHLVLTADNTGSLYTVTINDAGTNLGLLGATDAFDSGNFVTTQVAQDAQIRVDGYPPASWITRTSNTVDDIINGVTFNLKSTTSGSTETINIQEDYTQMKQDIQDWVDVFNEVMIEISAKTRYDEENEIMGVLMGDSSASSVKSTLLTYASAAVPGLEENATYTNLSAIGIRVASGGQLTVNTTTLQEAMEEDLDAVINLFVRSLGSTSTSFEYFASTTATRGGEYEVTASWYANGRLKSGTIGGYEASVEYGNVLVGKSGTPVEGLRILFNYDDSGAGSETATVWVSDPVTTQTANSIDQWTDSIDGLIKIVKDAYEERIDNIDEELLNWERRLETKRQALESSFIAMESSITTAQSQSQWLSTI